VRGRQAVAAGDGELDAGVTVLASPTRVGPGWPLTSTSNRGASPSMKAPRSDVVVGIFFLQYERVRPRNARAPSWSERRPVS